MVLKYVVAFGNIIQPKTSTLNQQFNKATYCLPSQKQLTSSADQLYWNTFYKNKMKKNNNLAKGMALGIGIGTAVGVATNNLGLWLAVGVAIGAGVGNSLSKKDTNNNDES